MVKKARVSKQKFFEVLLLNLDVDAYDSFVVKATSEEEAMNAAREKAAKNWKPLDVRRMKDADDLYFYNEGACYVPSDG